MASRPDLWGERNVKAKLTSDEVIQIRHRRSTPELRQIWSYTKLAKEFGVSRTTIQKISCGFSWKHELTPIDLEDEEEL